MKRVSKYINFGISWYAVVNNRIVKGSSLCEIDLKNNSCFIVSDKGESIYGIRLTDLYNTKGEAELALKEEQK